MAIKVKGAFARKNFLDTPTGTGRSAAVFAVGEGKTPRLFIHGMRHTSHDYVAKAVDHVNTKRVVNPNNWHEVDITAYLMSGAVVLIDGGIVIRPGTAQDDGFEDGVQEQTQHELPQLTRVKHGWTLS